jgi:hypothetical protein
MCCHDVDLERDEVLQTSGRGRAPRPEANPRVGRRSSRPLRRHRPRARRPALAMLLTAVVAAVWIGVADGSAAAPPGAAPGAATAVLVVAPGDTLWELASAHAPAGADPQAWAAAVAARNHIDGGALEPGTVLEVPAVTPANSR